VQNQVHTIVFRNAKELTMNYYYGSPSMLAFKIM